MDCTHCQDLFSAHAGHELDPETLKHLESHLASCGNCSREWVYFNKTMQCLAQMEPLQAPPDILPGIHEKLNRPSGLSSLIQRLRQIDFTLSMPAAVTTVIVALLIPLVFKTTPHDQANLSIAPGSTATVTQQSASTSSDFPGKQIQTTPVANYAGGTPPIQRTFNSYPLSTYDFLNTYIDQRRRPVCSLGDNNRITNQFNPDLLVSVQPDTPAGQINLHKSLMTSKRWAARLHNNKLFFIYLNPDALPELHQTLIQHNAYFFPPETVLPYLSARKSMLTVAVQLR